MSNELPYLIQLADFRIKHGDPLQLVQLAQMQRLHQFVGQTDGLAIELHHAHTDFILAHPGDGLLDRVDGLDLPVAESVVRLKNIGVWPGFEVDQSLIQAIHTHSGVVDYLRWTLLPEPYGRSPQAPIEN